MKPRLAQAAFLSMIVAGVFTLAFAASSSACIYGNSASGVDSIPTDSPASSVDAVDASNNSFTADSASTSVDGQSNFNKSGLTAGLLAAIGIVAGGTIAGGILLKLRRAGNLEPEQPEFSEAASVPEDAFATSNFSIVVPASALVRSNVLEESEACHQVAASQMKN